MDKGENFSIVGLAGKKKLVGEIKVSGAKNAALKVLAASILFDEKIELRNVPVIEDIKRIGEIIEGLGMKVTVDKKGSIDSITPPKKLNAKLCPVLSKRVRASIVLTGPLLARTGHVEFPHPGGCLIGERPIDLFLEGYKKMGATVSVGAESYIITAPKSGLQGVSHFLRNPSVTVTETLMMAGVLANGKTVIKNAALEPEIKHLADFLNACGAKITGAGTTTVSIVGVKKPLKAKKKYVTLPDRIEAGSYIILAALAGKDVKVTGLIPDNIESLTELLTLVGVNIEVGKNYIRVTSDEKGKDKALESVNIKTMGYPGFPTDLQALITVLMTQSKGDSLIHETIWEGRFGYVESLKAMDADISVMDPHRILVKGNGLLRAKELVSPDLRAGMAFIIAAIIAKGTSLICNTYIVKRGYEDVEEKLKAIGVDISRQSVGVCNQ